MYTGMSQLSVTVAVARTTGRKTRSFRCIYYTAQTQVEILTLFSGGTVAFFVRMHPHVRGGLTFEAAPYRGVGHRPYLACTREDGGYEGREGQK